MTSAFGSPALPKGISLVASDGSSVLAVPIFLTGWPGVVMFAVLHPGVSGTAPITSV